MSNTHGDLIIIQVKVVIDNNLPVFSYTCNGKPFEGALEIDKESTITYQLIDKTDKGLKFAGAGFKRPFDGIIDAVALGDNGNLLQLIDLDKVVGSAGFQFVLTNSTNSLMLVSPDPQIINRL